MNLNYKRAIVTDYLPWVLIAVILLVLLMLAALVMKDKLYSFIEPIKNLFR